jgi:hypothetical protein
VAKADASSLRKDLPLEAVPGAALGGDLGVGCPRLASGAPGVVVALALAALAVVVVVVVVAAAGWFGKKIYWGIGGGPLESMVAERGRLQGRHSSVGRP